MKAIKNCNSEQVSKLTNAGFPINDPLQDTDKITALLYCASKGDENCMKVLINAGADINLRDKSGHTVIHHACKGQNLETLRFMF